MSKSNRNITRYKNRQAGLQSKSASLHVSNHLPTIDPKNPIPFEDKNRVWGWDDKEGFIPFLGANDDFDRHLLKIRNLSITHDRCIMTKRDYCAGNGFYDTDDREFPQAMKDWFADMNLKGETATDLSKIILEGKFSQGNQPIEIVLSDVAGKKDAFIYAHDLEEWRLGVPDANGVVTYAVQSRRFGDKTLIWASDTYKNQRIIPIYNPHRTDAENWKVDGSTRRTLIWYKEPKKGFPNYGMPSSVASILQQLCEYKGTRFNLSILDNKGIPGGILILQGMLSQLEADRIGRKANDMISGDGNQGRILAIASEEGVDKSAFHPFDTKHEGSYIEASRFWMEVIFFANEWDPILAGMVSPSTMGKGSGFLTKLWELKKATVIWPTQDNLMEKVWKPIFKIVQEHTGLPFSDFDIKIRTGIQISPLTDIDITGAVQVNEVREAIDRPADPKKEGVYMNEVKQAKPQGGATDVPA